MTGDSSINMPDVFLGVRQNRRKTLLAAGLNNRRPFSVIGCKPAQANPSLMSRIARSMLWMVTCCPTQNHPAPEHSRKISPRPRKDGTTALECRSLP